MKPLRHHKMLGLVFGERSILAAEVHRAGARQQEPASLEATRLAEFVFPPGATLEEPEALGKALGEFLKENRFSARRAVLGMPAKRLVVKSKEVPPAAPSLVAEMLRLQAEGEFSAELKDLVYDYAGESSTSEPRRVLLMATPQPYLDKLLAVAKAARLSVDAVTPTATALGAASGRLAKDALVLSLGPTAAEFTAQRGPSPYALRHLGPSSPQAGFLGELRRTVSLMPGTAGARTGGGGIGNNGPDRELVVWGDAGDGVDASGGAAAGDDNGENAARAIGDSLGGLGIPVRSGDLAALGVSAPAGSNGAARRYAAAVALAVGGMSAGGLPVDFLHSRLEPPRKKAIDRRILWAAAVTLAVVVAVVAALHNLHRQQADLNELTVKLDRMKGDLHTAELFVSKVSYAQAWHGGRPKFFACLMDLTDPKIGIPDDGQTYITSFNLHENMKGSFTGKSTSDRNVLTILDRLKASGRFTDVKMSLDAREAKTGREVTFTMSFNYVGYEKE